MSSKLSIPDQGPGHPGKGSRRRSGMPPAMLVFLMMLPFSCPLGIAMVQGQAVLWPALIDLCGLLVAAAALSRALGLRLRIRGLADNSTVLIIPGKKRLLALVQTLCIAELGAVFALFCLEGNPLPRPVLWLLLLQAAVFLNFPPLASSVQYWLRTCVILRGKVIAYEQVESVIQIPWQGFDVRMKGGRGTVEIRMKNDSASQLLDSLKPVLSPYGIKLQTRGGEKPA